MRYYKVLPGTNTFKLLMDFKKKMAEAKNKARALGKELGYAQIATSNYDLAGGIAGFHIPHGQKVPADWKVVGENYQRFFYPKATVRGNKELLAKIKALPILQYEELNKIFNINHLMTGENTDGPGIAVYKCPQIRWAKDFIIVNIPVKGIKVPNDMMLITSYDYEKLLEKIDKKKPKVKAKK